MESTQNNYELNDAFTQSNMLNNLDLFDKQKITQTIYDPNFNNNQEPKMVDELINIPAEEAYQNKDGEVPYTFVGEFNFDSNLGAPSQIKNTNLNLFNMNNNQNILDSATTNTQLIPRNQSEEPKNQNLISNLNIETINTNINTNLPGTEEKYTFDSGIFDINNINPSQEMNYSDSANIFSKNNVNVDVNNNNFITNETNQNNNINNFNNINEIFNTDYAQTVYHNPNNPNPNTNVNLLNVLTFGESGQNAQPIIETPQTDFTENQNVYHEYNNDQPKIENEQINLNTNNIIGNEKKETENILNSINDDNHMKSPFETIKENKTVLLENKPTIENNNNNNIEVKPETFPEVKKIDEKKEEEINTIILPNDDNVNKKENNIQLTNNVPVNIEEPPKIEEKKEENKLIDISDEIKEIKEMPEKPFEQRDAIFNKNNIKVIKIENEETTFCGGLFAPLFKKLFG